MQSFIANQRHNLHLGANIGLIVNAQCDGVFQNHNLIKFAANLEYIFLHVSNPFIWVRSTSAEGVFKSRTCLTPILPLLQYKNNPDFGVVFIYYLFYQVPTFDIALTVFVISSRHYGAVGF